MESPKPGYEAFFRFTQRPFSLTPDPKFYFRSRSHSRVFDMLSAAIARREKIMLVLGDLGVGKTTLCRTLLDLQERKSRAALLANALLSPDDLLRLMLQDLGALSTEAVRQGRLTGATRPQLLEIFDAFLLELKTAGHGAVLIVDEAHSLPPATLEQIFEIASLDSNRDRLLQFLLAGQPAVALPSVASARRVSGAPIMPKHVDDTVSARARLLPLERDECERYLNHRLDIAGSTAVAFSARAVEVIYTLSGGVPRLVNLLGERALQEAAVVRTHRIEPGMIESAASALDLIHLRPRRFRWYGTN